MYEDRIKALEWEVERIRTEHDHLLMVLRDVIRDEALKLRVSEHWKKTAHAPACAASGDC